MNGDDTYHTLLVAITLLLITAVLVLCVAIEWPKMSKEDRVEEEWRRIEENFRKFRFIEPEVNEPRSVQKCTELNDRLVRADQQTVCFFIVDCWA